LPLCRRHGGGRKRGAAGRTLPPCPAPGTLVAWENNHCLHYPVADYFPHERKLLRIAITGEPIHAVPEAA